MDFSPGGSQNLSAPAAFKVLTASRFFSSGFVPCDLLGENYNIFLLPLITWTIFLYSYSSMFRKICCCSVWEAPEQVTFTRLATRFREKTAACVSLLHRVSKVIKSPIWSGYHCFKLFVCAVCNQKDALGLYWTGKASWRKWLRFYCLKKILPRNIMAWILGAYFSLFLVAHLKINWRTFAVFTKKLLPREPSGFANCPDFWGNPSFV